MLKEKPIRKVGSGYFIEWWPLIVDYALIVDNQGPPRLI